MKTTTFAQLWQDESGVVISAELIVVCTVVVLGMLVGLTTLRDQVVQEFADLAAAVGALDHSYSFAAFEDADCSVAGSSFTDESDSCDVGDPVGEPASCVMFTSPGAE